MRLEPRPGTRLFMRQPVRPGGERRLYEYDTVTGLSYRLRIKDMMRTCRVYYNLNRFDNGLYAEILPSYLRLPEGL